MDCIRRLCIGSLVAFFLVLPIAATISSAADFTLAWNSNCNGHPDLIGYNLYYKEGGSILENPEDSVMIYIPLTEEGFDPENPSYKVTGLKDDVEYYFTVSAMYNDEESGMSNEVSDSIRDFDSASTSENSAYENDLFRAGCFISALD